MITTPPASAWDCGGCTACCRHFALGPVSDRIIDGLEAHGVRQAWAPAASGFAHKQPGPDGEPAWFLDRREDGACIFLEEDGRCGVHARWGAAAKPAFCREYPFALVQEAQTLRVFVRADCGGWAESFQSGAPTSEQVQAIVDLPRIHPPGSFTMDPVVVLPGLGLGRDSWPTVESHLQPLLAEVRPIDDTVHAVVDTLYDLVGRERVPAAPGRVDAAIAHVHARLRAALGPALAHPPGDDPEIRGMLAYLAEVDTLLAEAQPRLPSGPQDRRPPPSLAPSALDYVAMVLRHQLHGRTFQDLGGLPGWLGSMVVGVRIAAAAASQDNEPVSARQLGPRLATWVRLTRHATARRLLGDMGPVLQDVFLHAGAPRQGA